MPPLPLRVLEAANSTANAAASPGIALSAAAAATEAVMFSEIASHQIGCLLNTYGNSQGQPSPYHEESLRHRLQLVRCLEVQPASEIRRILAPA